MDRLVEGEIGFDDTPATPSFGASTLVNRRTRSSNAGSTLGATTSR
jgi:hypothetical protein